MDITSANSSLTFSIRNGGIVGIPSFTVEGYASDAAFAGDTVDVAEAVMGVDAKMSVGYTPRITKQMITLQADSPSIGIFEAILLAMDAIRSPVFLDAVLSLPSTQKSYVFKLGVMTRVTPFSAGKKILQPQEYEVSWEQVIPVPLPV